MKNAHTKDAHWTEHEESTLRSSLDAAPAIAPILIKLETISSEWREFPELLLAKVALPPVPMRRTQYAFYRPEGIRPIPLRYPPCWSSKVSKPLPAFGFLTALADSEHGYFGGYLVLSEMGRPLEFHCTTPVLPNQAQRILYGKTLTAYVLGDLIGQALLSKSQLPVTAVLTDQRDMLGLTLLRDEVIICVESNDHTDEQAEQNTGPHFSLGSYQLFGSATCLWQPSEQQQALSNLATRVDLNEPFDRIREAIREAQRVSDSNTDERHDIADAA